MTDTTEQVQPEQGDQLIIGAEVGAKLKENARAKEAAREAYEKALAEVSAPLEEYRRATYALLPGRYSMAESLITMAEGLTVEKRQRRITEETGAYDTVKGCLKEERNKIIATDPLLNHLFTFARRHSYHSHIQEVLGILPATLAEIKTLAEVHGWCTSFEALFASVAEENGIEFGSITYTCGVEWDDVPDEHKAEDGETWEATYTLPAYMRPHRYSIYELGNYATAVTYRRAG